jgi:hypothetical protein
MISSSAPRRARRASLPRPAVLRPAGGLFLAGVLLTSACGTAGSDAAATAGQPVQGAGEHAHDAAGTAVVPAGAASPTPPPPAATPAAGTDPAVAVRTNLERMLGAHVLLADEVVRAQLLGRDDQVRASSASVGRNTDELVEAVTSLTDAGTGQQFRTTWERHVEVLGQYATALQEEDEAAQRTARDAYATAEQELAAALSAVVGGKVPQAALTAATTRTASTCSARRRPTPRRTTPAPTRSSGKPSGT